MADLIVNVQDSPYNAKTDGTDATGAIQAALTAIINSPDRSGVVYFPAGTYRIEGSLSAFFDDSGPGASQGQITLRGETGTILDGTLSTAPSLLAVGGKPPTYDGGQWPNFDCSASTGQPLLSAAMKGEKAIRIDTTMLAPLKGDVLLISTHEYCDTHPGDSSQAWNPRLFNCTPQGNVYLLYKGEMVEVAEGPTPGGGAQDIALKAPLFDSYSPAPANATSCDIPTKVYKLTMPTVSVHNLEIHRNHQHTGLSIQYARDVVLDGCACSGASYSGFQLKYVYCGTCLNNTTTDVYIVPDASSEEGYGLAIDSSQFISTFGNRLYARRHALKHGGWEPVRRVAHRGNTLDNQHGGTPAAVVQCLDFHDDAEFAVVIGNTIVNGIACSARNVTITQNFISAHDGLAAVELQPSQNDDLVQVTDNQIIALTGNGIHLGPLADNVRISSLDISRNTIRAASNGIAIDSGQSGPVGLILDDVASIDNDVVASVGPSAFQVRGSNLVQIDRLALTGGSYKGLSAFFTDGLTNSGTLTLCNAKLSSGLNYCLRSDPAGNGFRRAVVDGCELQFDGLSGGPNRLAVTEDLTWINNTIRNLGGADQVALVGKSLVVQNGVLEECLGIFRLSGHILRPITLRCGPLLTPGSIPNQTFNLLTYDLADGSAVEAIATFVGRENGGRSAIFRRRFGGNAMTVIGTDITDDPGWTATLSMSGTSFVVDVEETGGSAATWFIRMELT